MKQLWNLLESCRDKRTDDQKDLINIAKPKLGSTKDRIAHQLQPGIFAIESAVAKA